MVLGIKVAALAACALIGGSTAGQATCSCAVETIACTGGVSSFAQAPCTVQQQTGPDVVTVTLKCPPSDPVAISGAFRALVFPPKRLFTMAPLIPSGDHASAYQFQWRGTNASANKVYVTCGNFS